jgi:hypothetical protein
MIRKTIITAAALGAVAASGAAVAAPAQDAIEACRVAIEANAGQDVVSKLTKIKSRGANYEVWLSVKAEDQDQRTYCYLRRGQLDQFVVEDGSWVGRNPKRPESVDLG